MQGTYHMLQQTLCTPGSFFPIQQQVLELSFHFFLLEFQRILAKLSWPDSSTLPLILHVALISTLDSMSERKGKNKNKNHKLCSSTREIENFLNANSPSVYIRWKDHKNLLQFLLLSANILRLCVVIHLSIFS